MINKRSTRYFCKEDITTIENYDKAIADDTQMWTIHHRLETHFSNGTERPANARLTKAELIALNMYFDRPAEELIFVTKAEHNRLHFKGKPSGAKGKQWSKESKQKLSEARKGWHYSEETRKKLSEAHKGKKLSEEHKLKLIESHKGKRMSEDTKRKISEAQKARLARQKI